VDKALRRQFERGKAPFDGLTLQLNVRPPEQLVADLRRLVSCLADRRKALRAFSDWWEHDGATLPSEPATWEALEAEIADVESLWRSNPGEYYVRRAWYAADFSFLLRWYLIDDQPDEPIYCDADLTAPPQLVYALAEETSDVSIAPARRWYLDRLA
jgi:hypothetical protein